MFWSRTCAYCENFSWGKWISHSYPAVVANNSFFRSTRRWPWSSFNHGICWIVNTHRFGSRFLMFLAIKNSKQAPSCTRTETFPFVVTTTFPQRRCNGFWTIYSYSKIIFAFHTPSLQNKVCTRIISLRKKCITVECAFSTDSVIRPYCFKDYTC